jgi:hypothetical protein
MIGWLTVWLGIFAWLLFVVQADPNERGKLERRPWLTVAILAGWPVVYPLALLLICVGGYLAAREGKTLREWLKR